MNEKLIYEVLRMLNERRRFWSDNLDRANAVYTAMAYDSACDMLRAAIDGREDILREFDYYGEDE